MAKNVNFMSCDFYDILKKLSNDALYEALTVPLACASPIPTGETRGNHIPLSVATFSSCRTISRIYES